MGDDSLLQHVMKFLSPSEIVKIIPTSRHWGQCASDDHVWSPLCEELFRDKVYTPFSEAPRRIEAYWLSLRDSKRTGLTAEAPPPKSWYHVNAGPPRNCALLNGTAA